MASRGGHQIACGGRSVRACFRCARTVTRHNTSDGERFTWCSSRCAVTDRYGVDLRPYDPPRTPYHLSFALPVHNNNNQINSNNDELEQLDNPVIL
ncbi:unnamed protein product [Colias eurytheme]|nr:unnamed protein product [Colias eurytheme]